MKYLLADYLREQANWRLDQAVQFDDGGRNARSAAALNDAAVYVEQLDDDDLRLLRINAAYHVTEIGEFDPGARGEHLVSMWGCDPSGLDGTPVAFLYLLVECSEEDAVQFFRDLGEQSIEFFRNCGEQDFG